MPKRGRELWDYQMQFRRDDTPFTNVNGCICCTRVRVQDTTNDEELFASGK